MVNNKSNTITCNVRVLYLLKRTGGSLQFGKHSGNCSSAATC